MTHDDQQLAAIIPVLVLKGFPPTSLWKQLFVEGIGAELLLLTLYVSLWLLPLDMSMSICVSGNSLQQVGVLSN